MPFFFWVEDSRQFFLYSGSQFFSMTLHHTSCSTMACVYLRRKISRRNVAVSLKIDPESTVAQLVIPLLFSNISERQMFKRFQQTKKHSI